MTKETVADMNDRIRAKGLFGPGEPTELVLTPGVADLGEDAIGMLTFSLMKFDDFEESCTDRDFGTLKAPGGQEVWFKIDQTADPEVRTITLLLPSEY